MQRFANPKYKSNTTLKLKIELFKRKDMVEMR